MHNSGGTATVSYNYGSYSGSLQFTINGNSAFPTKPQAQAYITANQSPSWGQSWATGNPSQSWGQLWFLTFVGSHETFSSCSLADGYHQFDANFLPCWGTPYGYGLMQIEQPNTITNPPYSAYIPRESILWNWQANVQASLLEFQYKNGPKDPKGAYNYWTHPAGTFGNTDQGGQLDQFLKWNSDHNSNPSQQVDVPIVTCSQNSTCAYANPGPGDCPFGMNKADGSVPNLQRSYADAVWIKMYNGAVSGNYIFWNNTGSRASNPIWDYHPSEQPPTVTQPVYYVRDVCNQ